MAEGIENEDVLERLTKLGCDTGQGYLFGKAAPASVTSEALRKEAERQGVASSSRRRIA